MLAARAAGCLTVLMKGRSKSVDSAMESSALLLVITCIGCGGEGVSLGGWGGFIIVTPLGRLLLRTSDSTRGPIRKTSLRPGLQRTLD